MKNVLIVVLCNLIALVSYAGFHCPDDITINCDMDVHNTDMTGYPNTTGVNVNFPISYTDTDITNGCGVGKVIRTWYQDLNNNQIIDGADPFCNQEITVAYLENGLFDINWPSNKDLNCIADISFEAPEIVHGPCDLVGYVYEDQIFELTNDACYKILRSFTVINWCTYDESSPSIGGIYTHTQVIKVTEEELPEFTHCEDITIAMDEGCQANVSISARARDIGDCPSDKLYWTVEVDLDWDLVIDYEYSYLMTGDRYLAPTANNEELSITLPELVDGGTHGAYFTVKDGCGNVRSCQQKIYVEDQKAPTPYCHVILNAAFDADAMPAMVPADLFNVGAFDNCTASEDLRFSFSQDVEDDVKVITCGSQGFQFFNIYVTDLEGNSDFCEVYMLIFDNDGCQFRFAPRGTVRDISGEALEGVSVYLTDGQDVMYEAMSESLGEFEFVETELNSEYYLMTDVAQEEDFEPTIMHLKLLQQYMLGLTDYTSAYQYVMADINRDRAVNPFDVVALRNHLLGISLLDKDAFNVYIESESIEESWKNYKTKIDYMDYDGSFDLLNVKLEDLASIETVEYVQEVEIIASDMDKVTTIKYRNPESMKTNGVEVVLQLPKHLEDSQVIVASSTIDLSTNDYYYNSNTGILKVISLHDYEVMANTEWLTIQIDTEEYINGNGHVNWLEGNTLHTNENIVTKKNLEVDKVENESLLLTNLVEEKLLFNEVYINGAVRIYDMNANEVASYSANKNSIDIGDLNSGMYIIQWSNGNSMREAKFFKK